MASYLVFLLVILWEPLFRSMPRPWRDAFWMLTLDKSFQPAVFLILIAGILLTTLFPGDSSLERPKIGYYVALLAGLVTISYIRSDQFYSGGYSLEMKVVSGIWAGIVLVRCCRTIVGEGMMVGFALIIGFILMGASFPSYEWAGSTFANGFPRHHGLWTDPNTFGIISGSIILYSTCFAFSCKWQSAYEIIRGVLYSILMVLALTHTLSSLSRAAWLGVVCGFGVIVWNVGLKCKAAKNAVWIAVGVALAISVFIWKRGDFAGVVVARSASAFDSSDNSWMNRVRAWIGASRIWLKKPIVGVGVSRVEENYKKIMLELGAKEPYAIELNGPLLLLAGCGIGASLIVIVEALAFRLFLGSNLLLAALLTCFIVGTVLSGVLHRAPLNGLFWCLIIMSAQRLQPIHSSKSTVEDFADENIIRKARVHTN